MESLSTDDIETSVLSGEAEGWREERQWEERKWNWGKDESPYREMMASEDRLLKVFHF